MKFGCILKLLAIIIVILGTSFYLYDKYGKNYITESTAKAKEVALSKIEKLVDDFTEKEITNPLKEKFADLLIDVEQKKDQFSDTQFDEIFKKFNKIIKENNLNDKSFEELKKIIDLKK